MDSVRPKYIEIWTFCAFSDTRKPPKFTNVRIFAQSEKVKIQQKSLTSPLNAWTINTSIYQLHCVKIWRVIPPSRSWDIPVFVLTENCQNQPFFGWLVPDMYSHSGGKTLVIGRRLLSARDRVPRNPWPIEGTWAKSSISCHFHRPAGAVQGPAPARQLDIQVPAYSPRFPGLHHELHKLVSWFQFDIWIATVFKSKLSTHTSRVIINTYFKSNYQHILQE